MRRIAVVVTTLALALVAMPGSAGAASRQSALRYFGVGHGPAVGDGHKELALLSTHDALQIYIWRGPVAGLRITSVRRPNCVGEASLLGAIHGGTIAWSCSYVPNVLLQDIVSGQVRSLIGNPVTWGDSERFEVNGLGNRWVRVVTSGYHWTGAENYLDLTTGRLRVLSQAPQYADLNSPQLVRRLCAPLTRSENPNTLGDLPPFQPYFYEHPYGATVVLGRGDDPTATQKLVLERCGSHHKRVLDRCRNGCSSLQLTGGILTWFSGTRAHAYVTRSRREYTWKLPLERDQIWGGATVLHLGRRVFASVPPHAGGSDWTYWSAWLPKDAR